MKGRSHRKQILLFLITVLLPSFVLVFLTLRMIDQEKELSQKRLSEERIRKAREIGQSLLVKLENIKLQEVSANSEQNLSHVQSEYVNHEVVLIGIVEDRRLLLPWEKNLGVETAKKQLNDPEFAQKIRLGEREEFSRKNFDRASRLYSQTMNTAKHQAQKEYTRLLLARVLSKATKKKEAITHYRKLLALSFDVSDELGIPFSFYAASRLLEIEEEYGDVMNRIQSQSLDFRWLAPEAAYLLQNLLDRIGRGSPDNAVQKNAEEILESTREYLQKIQQVQSLQNDFSALGLMANLDSIDDNDRPLWVSYQNVWLVSLDSAITSCPEYLIAVDTEKILDSLRNDKDFAETFSVDFRTVSADDSEGLSVGSSIRGLKITFSGNQDSWIAEPWVVQPAYYLIALVLILGITLFGAYLLWRDIRRDVRMAEMRSQFVSSVSHELKTPLTAIRMFAETLRLGRSKDKKAQEEYLDTIVNESQRLTRLLNNVLDFSKIEQGKRIYRPEPSSLYDIIQTVARTMEYPLSQQGFRLNVQTEEGLPGIRADRDAIEQALLNLLHNAMKYSGGAKEIGLQLKKKDRYALIQVIDHGIGIDPQEQKKIFEKFYRGSTSENERIAGTGLGLALVSHIVQSHGGKMEVESEPGKGSTFSILLPLEKK
jgi:signal transduction histidine kinase